MTRRSPKSTSTSPHFPYATLCRSVPGAGLPLLRAIEAVEREETQCEGDERTGLRILRRALEAPTRQIAENSSFDGGVVVDRMRSGTRSEEHTSELQSLMRKSYAVFCLKKKNQKSPLSTLHNT